MFQNVLEKSNKKVILLGNEAIVRGALEAGVRFVSTYPGTPASEIGNTFWEIYKSQTTNYKQNTKHKTQTPGFHFEFSTNEKVAMEAAAGASFCGLRCLVAMKNFGLNVASDFLLPLVYSGVKGGMVIVVADDPNCWSSAQTEENSRGFANLAHIPILEPSDPQECKDFVKFAFDLSEKFKIPIMIRETTRVAHQSAPVILKQNTKHKLQITNKTQNTNYKFQTGKFIKDTRQFVTMPPRVLEMHQELLQKIKKIQEFSERSKINLIIQDGRDPSSPKGRERVSLKAGIITSGASYLYVIEALKELNLSLPVLKLGFFHPLPERKIKGFIKGLEKVLIVEELEPFLEKEAERLAKEVNPALKIFGKNVLPEVGELKPEIVFQALAKFTNKKLKIKNYLKIKNLKLKISRRCPQLCPGCPYWFVFNGVKKALRRGSGQAVVGKNVIFGGDIGCYMLAGLPPHNIQDYLYCMGSSIGIAHGIKKACSRSSFLVPSSKGGNEESQKLIAFIGDSTFFHSGIPALINTVFNKSNPLIIIMDNQTTAMTGHQPHPGIRTDGAPVVKIEEIVKACGVKNLKVIDQINQKEFIKTVQQFLNKKDVSVIIARRPCKFVKKH